MPAPPEWQLQESAAQALLQLPDLTASCRRERVRDLVQSLVDEFEALYMRCDFPREGTEANASPRWEYPIGPYGATRTRVRKDDARARTVPARLFAEPEPEAARNLPSDGANGAIAPAANGAPDINLPSQSANVGANQPSPSSQRQMAQGGALEAPISGDARYEIGEEDGILAQYAAKSTFEDLQQLATCQLTEEQIVSLRKHFEELDTDMDDLISLEQCADLVEEFVGHQLDHEVLKSAFMELQKTLAAAGNDAKREPDDAGFIDFDHFLLIMGGGGGEMGESGLSKVFDTLRDAFEAAERFNTELAERQAEQTRKHDMIVFLLDLIPAPVIMTNAIIMGLRADITQYEEAWNFLDLCFLIFYVLEAIVKLGVFGPMVYFLGPEKLWNWFDVGCIGVSCIDNVVPLIMGTSSDMGAIMLLKMLRLLKLGRLVKALKYPFFNELKAMIFGVVSGLRTLFWALVLLLIVIYFIAVVMNNLVGKDYVEFKTVPQSMFTIFRCFTDGCAAYDGTPLQEHLREAYGAIFMIAYILMMMLVTFGLFNLIMAIFMEGVMNTGTNRKQKELGSSAARCRLNIEEMFVKLIMNSSNEHSKKLQRHLKKKKADIDWENDVQVAFDKIPLDLSITRDIFNGWTKSDEFMDCLESSQVDTSNAQQLFDALDADMSGSLTPIEIVDGLMKLRGPITKCDMVMVMMKVKEHLGMFQASETAAKTPAGNGRDSFRS